MQTHQRGKSVGQMPWEASWQRLLQGPRRPLELRQGDTVVVVGEGVRPFCEEAALLVGLEGEVLGVEQTLSERRFPAAVVRNDLRNVRVDRGHIADLSLNERLLESWLARHPVRRVGDLPTLEREKEQLRREKPLIPDASADVLVCQFSLRDDHEILSRRAVGELYRVTKAGGRAVLLGCLADRPLPDSLRAELAAQRDPLATSSTEADVLGWLADAGFEEVSVHPRPTDPATVTDGVVFRPVLIRATRSARRNDVVEHGSPSRTVLEFPGGGRVGQSPEVTISDAAVHDYLQRHSDENIADRVCDLLVESLDEGCPRKRKVARCLGMSERNLQRRLADEGTSFRELLLAARFRLACASLRLGRMSKTDIAFSLGFADSSTFSRAFRRWAGCSPREYAARLKDEERGEAPRSTSRARISAS